MLAWIVPAVAPLACASICFSTGFPSSGFVGRTLQYPLRERTSIPPLFSFTFNVWQLPSCVSCGTYPNT